MGDMQELKELQQDQRMVVMVEGGEYMEDMLGLEEK